MNQLVSMGATASRSSLRGTSAAIKAAAVGSTALISRAAVTDLQLQPGDLPFVIAQWDGTV